ncbi:DUF2913 family protein [Carnobacterium gallinarum]|uniref:DUF2913 family protein n=1 Tax=Carnobacterium gallinarum TaxID=2749 RepID=UPI0005517866|nr:DUF2913 family protein [Carnobacterium gallinarum]
MNIEELPNLIKEKKQGYQLKKMFEKIAEAIITGIENGQTQTTIPFKHDDLEQFINELEEQHILVFIDPESEKVTIDWGLIS